VLLETPPDADDVTRDQLGFLFGGVIYRADNFGPSYILEFRDPDNIALELVAPKS